MGKGSRRIAYHTKTGKIIQARRDLVALAAKKSGLTHSEFYGGDRGYGASDNEKIIKDSHSKGMAKIGRQKTDMSGGNQVNRGIMRTGGTGLRGNVHTPSARSRGQLTPLPRGSRNPVGMAGAKRPKGPASASSVSAARKKAWATRRKKFGKSGGKKRG